MRKIWPFSFNFLIFASIATVLPFLVLFYQELGFTGTQIGLLTGIAPLVVFFSAPLWSRHADATGRHRLLLSLAMLAGIISLIVFPLPNAFLPVLLIAILLYFFLAPITPFADSAAMYMLADQKEMYGRIRLGGTIGFGLAAPIAGLFVQNTGLRFAFWGSAMLLLVGLFVSQKLVYSQSFANNQARSRVRILLSNPRWLLFLILAFAGGLGLAAFNNYLFPYMKELGADESTMGLAHTIGTISEIPTLFFGNRLIKQLKSYGLLVLSLVITGLRMLLFAASAAPAYILVVQLLNGLTIPAMWMAGVSYADEHASVGMSTTAQSLFSAMVLGFGTAVGGFIGGLLYESIGGRGLYFVFGIVVLTIVILAALIHGRLPAQHKSTLRTQLPN